MKVRHRSLGPSFRKWYNQVTNPVFIIGVSSYRCMSMMMTAILLFKSTTRIRESCTFHEIWTLSSVGGRNVRKLDVDCFFCHGWWALFILSISSPLDISGSNHLRLNSCPLGFFITFYCFNLFSPSLHSCHPISVHLTTAFTVSAGDCHLYFPYLLLPSPPFFFIMATKSSIFLHLFWV